MAQPQETELGATQASEVLSSCQWVCEHAASTSVCINEQALEKAAASMTEVNLQNLQTISSPTGFDEGAR